MECMIAWAAGKGCTALLTYLLSFVKSVTILTLLLSFLPTKNAGLHQSVGVETGVMIFFSSKSCTALLAGTSMRLGITLAVVTLSGTILSGRCAWVFLPWGMGSVGR